MEVSLNVLGIAHGDGLSSVRHAAKLGLGEEHDGNQPSNQNDPSDPGEALGPR